MQDVKVKNPAKTNPAVEQKKTTKNDNPFNSAAQNDRPLRIVLPKKGRLKNDVEQLLAKAGFIYIKDNDRQDFATGLDKQGNLPAFEILFQSSKDAAENTMDGIADIAIIGKDTLAEISSGKKNTPNATAIYQFNFAACALWIAAPERTNITNPADLNGKTIVTSYPDLLSDWLRANKVSDTKILERKGGIEDYVRLGVADAICDLVETGSSLQANQLAPKIKIGNSSAIMLVNNDKKAPSQEILIEKICERLAKASQSTVFSPGTSSIENSVGINLRSA